MAHNPSVTAGLMWQPEMLPMAYAITSNDRPKPRATPRTCTLPLGKNPPVASTAVPGPPSISTKVPMVSAPSIRTLRVMPVASPDVAREPPDRRSPRVPTGNRAERPFLVAPFGREPDQSAGKADRLRLGGAVPGQHQQGGIVLQQAFLVVEHGVAEDP